MSIFYPIKTTSQGGGFPVEIHLASGESTTVDSSHIAIGGTTINASADYSGRTFNYKVSGYAQTGSTLEAVLYNLTDSTPVYTASISSSVPTSLINSVSLSGNKFYEIRYKRVGGSSSDNVYLLNATIKIS